MIVRVDRHLLLSDGRAETSREVLARQSLSSSQKLKFPSPSRELEPPVRAASPSRQTEQGDRAARSPNLSQHWFCCYRQHSFLNWSHARSPSHNKRFVENFESLSFVLLLQFSFARTTRFLHQHSEQRKGPKRAVDKRVFRSVKKTNFLRTWETFCAAIKSEERVEEVSL